jgi:hypothetical protein
MKRFLLFAVHNYYPGGGWNDFQGSYDTLDEATIAGIVAGQKFDDWEIVDSTIEKVVA